MLKLQQLKNNDFNMQIKVTILHVSTNIVVCESEPYIYTQQMQYHKIPLFNQTFHSEKYKIIVKDKCSFAEARFQSFINNRFSYQFMIGSTQFEISYIEENIKYSNTHLTDINMQLNNLCVNGCKIFDEYKIFIHLPQQYTFQIPNNKSSITFAQLPQYINKPVNLLIYGIFCNLKILIHNQRITLTDLNHFDIYHQFDNEQYQYLNLYTQYSKQCDRVYSVNHVESELVFESYLQSFVKIIFCYDEEYFTDNDTECLTQFIQYCKQNNYSNQYRISILHNENAGNGKLGHLMFTCDQQINQNQLQKLQPKFKLSFNNYFKYILINDKLANSQMNIYDDVIEVKLVNKDNIQNQQQIMLNLKDITEDTSQTLHQKTIQLFNYNQQFQNFEIVVVKTENQLTQQAKQEQLNSPHIQIVEYKQQQLDENIINNSDHQQIQSKIVQSQKQQHRQVVQQLSELNESQIANQQQKLVSYNEKQQYNDDLKNNNSSTQNTAQNEHINPIIVKQDIQIQTNQQHISHIFDKEQQTQPNEEINIQTNEETQVDTLTSAGNVQKYSDINQIQQEEQIQENIIQNQQILSQNNVIDQQQQDQLTDEEDINDQFAQEMQEESSDINNQEETKNEKEVTSVVQMKSSIRRGDDNNEHISKSGNIISEDEQSKHLQDQYNSVSSINNIQVLTGTDDQQNNNKTHSQLNEPAEVNENQITNQKCDSNQLNGTLGIQQIQAEKEQVEYNQQHMKQKQDDIENLQQQQTSKTNLNDLTASQIDTIQELKQIENEQQLQNSIFLTQQDIKDKNKPDNTLNKQVNDIVIQCQLKQIENQHQNLNKDSDYQIERKHQDIKQDYTPGANQNSGQQIQQFKKVNDESHLKNDQQHNIQVELNNSNSQIVSNSDNRIQENKAPTLKSQQVNQIQEAKPSNNMRPQDKILIEKKIIQKNVKQVDKANENQNSEIKQHIIPPGTKQKPNDDNTSNIECKQEVQQQTTKTDIANKNQATEKNNQYINNQIQKLQYQQLKQPPQILKQQESHYKQQPIQTKSGSKFNISLQNSKPTVNNQGNAQAQILQSPEPIKFSVKQLLDSQIAVQSPQNAGKTGQYLILPKQLPENVIIEATEEELKQEDVRKLILQQRKRTEQQLILFKQQVKLSSQKQKSFRK